MLLLVRIKLWLVSIAFFLVLFENLVGARDIVDISSGLIGIAFIAVFSFFIKGPLQRKKLPIFMAHISFLIDASVVILVIYLNGGLETPWAFANVLITYMGAYVLGTPYGLFYAAYNSLGYLGVFLLEYYKVIPHFPTFGIEGLYWMDTGYFTDFLMGIFLMHFATAVSVGSLSRTTDKGNEAIEESIKLVDDCEARIKKAAQEAETVKKMLEDKNLELDRNRKISEDREKEIFEAESEVEMLKREKGV